MITLSKWVGAGAVAILSMSGLAYAQEEGGSFEYAPWSSDNYTARVSTSVNDAENVLSFSCGTASRGLMIDYTLEVASDDKGAVPAYEWSRTLKSGTITAVRSGHSDIYTAIRFTGIDPDGAYGPIISFEPSTRRGEWYDHADARLINSIKNADKVVISLRGSSKSISMSFSGAGSSAAIRGTDWCDPAVAM